MITSPPAPFVVAPTEIRTEPALPPEMLVPVSIDIWPEFFFAEGESIFTSPLEAEILLPDDKIRLPPLPVLLLPPRTWTDPPLERSPVALPPYNCTIPPVVSCANEVPAAISTFPARPRVLIPTDIFIDPADNKPLRVFKNKEPLFPNSESPELMVIFPLSPSRTAFSLDIFTIPVEDIPVPDVILIIPDPCAPDPALMKTSPPVPDIAFPPAISTLPP